MILAFTTEQWVTLGGAIGLAVTVISGAVAGAAVKIIGALAELKTATAAAAAAQASAATAAAVQREHLQAKTDTIVEKVNGAAGEQRDRIDALTEHVAGLTAQIAKQDKAAAVLEVRTSQELKDAMAAPAGEAHV